MDKSASSFQFKRYRVESIEFKVNEEFKPTEKVKLDFDINADVLVEDAAQQISRVVLTCVVFKNYRRANKPFRLKVSVSGEFQFKEKVSDADLREFSEINAVAVLFPYLRAVVTGVTAAANQPPLILPLINVYEFMRRKKGKAEETGGE
ncbi:MAG: protein-export chaperone SecB [Bacillota bacterium]